MRIYDRDKVLNLWQTGLTSRAIARRLCMADGASVRTLVQRARKKGDPRAKRRARGFYKGRMFTIRLPKASVPALLREADRRGTSAVVLSTELIAIIANDKLFDAVLGELPPT